MGEYQIIRPYGFPAFYHHGVLHAYANVSGDAAFAIPKTEEIKGSSVESNNGKEDLSETKRQKFDQTQEDGAVAENDVTEQQHDGHPRLALPDSATNMVKPAPTSEEEQEKKERRKQSNRESAKRSRLRKQKECEELEESVKALMAENSTLKKELLSLSEQCMQLDYENNLIEEEIRQIQVQGSAEVCFTALNLGSINADESNNNKNTKNSESNDLNS